MKTHKNELLKIAKYVRSDMDNKEPKEGLVLIGEMRGALVTLETLNLFG